MLTPKSNDAWVVPVLGSSSTLEIIAGLAKEKNLHIDRYHGDPLPKSLTNGFYSGKATRIPEKDGEGYAACFFVVDEKIIILREYASEDPNGNRERMADIFLDYLIEKGIDITND